MAAGGRSTASSTYGRGGRSQFVKEDIASSSLHDSHLLRQPVEEKYKIREIIPKSSSLGRGGVGIGSSGGDSSKLLLPTCSNAYLFRLTKTWDKGTRAVRERILKEFVESMNNATGPQLERELNNGASLFLTRISAWLRLTYLLGQDLALQLKALTVFVSAASGNRFLTEFLEVGGILTVLEILTIPQAKESDRAEALKLLIRVAGNGRKYKEFICESYGVRQVTECLSKAKSEITQDNARNLLISLGTGNPKFQMQVFKGLQSLVSSPAVAPTSQQMSAQALRTLLLSAENFPNSLVDASASLLRSQHMQVQYEGYELLKELMQRPQCQETIIVILVSFLRNVFEPVSEEHDKHRQKEGKNVSLAQWSGLAIEDQKERERLISGYIQQSYATKLIGVLIASSDDLAEKLIKNQLVSALLNVIANITHPESQKYATDNLLHLVNRFEYVALALRENMGQNFFDLLENKPDTFYRELTKEQVRYLRRNNIKIRNAEGGKDDESDSGSESDEDGRKRPISIFPNAMPKEAEVVEKIEPVKPVQASEAIEHDIKLQQQIILDSYENQESSKPKKVVEDVYTQFQHAGVNATFPGNKYATSGNGVERAQFESELDKFRTRNKIRADHKKVFEPTLSEETTTRLEEVKSDHRIFSHEKMINDIDKHLNMSGAAQDMSADDQAMLLALNYKFDDEGPPDDEEEEEVANAAKEAATSEGRPLSSSDDELNREIDMAFKKIDTADQNHEDDGWDLDQQKTKTSTLAENEEGTMESIDGSGRHSEGVNDGERMEGERMEEGGPPLEEGNTPTIPSSIPIVVPTSTSTETSPIPE